VSAILSIHRRVNVPACAARLGSRALPVTPMIRRASREALSQMVSKGGWSRAFEDPTPLPKGR
jgi:hypothetical protein